MPKYNRYIDFLTSFFANFVEKLIDARKEMRTKYVFLLF